MAVNVNSIAEQVYRAKVESMPKYKQTLTRPEKWGPRENPDTVLGKVWIEAQRIAQNKVNEVTTANQIATGGTTGDPVVDKYLSRYVDKYKSGEMSVADLRAALETDPYFTGEISFAESDLYNRDGVPQISITNRGLAEERKSFIDDIINSKINGFSSSYGDYDQMSSDLAGARLDQLRRQRLAQTSAYRYDPTRATQAVATTRTTSYNNPYTAAAVSTSSYA